MTKKETRKLDKIWSEKIRSRGKCERCKKPNGLQDGLQAAHIFSRTYRTTRWSELNGLCFCWGCHFWAHKNPIDFAEFVKDYLGEDNYDKLRAERNLVKKVDYATVFLELTKSKVTV